MKAKFNLIVTLTVILAFSYAAEPVNAQRRSYNKEVVKEKNDTPNDKKRTNTYRTGKADESKTKSRQTTSGARRTFSRGNQSGAEAKSSNTTVIRRESSTTRQRNANREENQQPASVQRRLHEKNRSNLRNAPERQQRESFRSNGSVRNGAFQSGAVSARANREHNQKLYRIDSKDRRYEPAKNYKGNKNLWKAGYVKHHVHYKEHNENYYKNYNYRKHLHWDHNWESYQWNVNSWRDYYNGYHPYSYRFSKHYFYHPAYGHVIRKFGYKPEIFVHNHMRYYNYNGHFFRHFPGVGYVLTDMPFGLVFQKLPRHAERVSINGFLYFRVGNLFFESNPHGYALIHYPERYYALDADFHNGGYYREADFYIYR